MLVFVFELVEVFFFPKESPKIISTHPHDVDFGVEWRRVSGGCSRTCMRMTPTAVNCHSMRVRISFPDCGGFTFARTGGRIAINRIAHCRGGRDSSMVKQLVNRIDHAVSMEVRRKLILCERSIARGASVSVRAARI